MNPLNDFLLEKTTQLETQVISAFPGVGKSYLFKEYKDKKILDSDSMNYSWITKDGVKERNPDFPNNYIKHIKDNIGKADYILVSSHKDVRDALVKNNINFTLVYPNIELKDEFIQRYKDRGSDEKFIEFISSNWNNFIQDLEQQKCNKNIELKSGQYLSDVI